MEQAIDQMDVVLPKLTNFILPGPTKDISMIHIARSVCRRAERLVVALAKKETSEGISIDPSILEYLNRLSDYLFQIARFIAYETKNPEVIWKGTMRKK
jgi:cob(I)alamin adenosyltransferase